jgi:hypothetical protein
VLEERVHNWTLGRVAALAAGGCLTETLLNKHAKIRAALEVTGMPIGANDLWIAAQV